MNDVVAERKVSEAEKVGRTLVTVELLVPYRSAMGSRWGAGERAGFQAEEARDLIKRGIARPPADKMLKGDRTQTK